MGRETRRQRATGETSSRDSVERANRDSSEREAAPSLRKRRAAFCRMTEMAKSINLSFRRGRSNFGSRGEEAAKKMSLTRLIT